jgi:hypothetical protein
MCQALRRGRDRLRHRSAANRMRSRATIPWTNYRIDSIADGYNAYFGDASDARLWRAFDLGGRKFGVMTAFSIVGARDWIPSFLALYPDLQRLWVARTTTRLRGSTSSVSKRWSRPRNLTGLRRPKRCLPPSESHLTPSPLGRSGSERGSRAPWPRDEGATEIVGEGAGRLRLRCFTRTRAM